MATLQLTGKDLRAIGFPEGPVISVAMNVMNKQYKHHPKEAALQVLANVLAEPASFAADEVLGKIAGFLLPTEPKNTDEIALRSHGAPFNIFGAAYIEEGALQQMHTAMKLPVSVAGALMPDAHSGYGLPIGGVLATEGAVIPFGVGVDIGCRMCLSVFDMAPIELQNRETFFVRELNEATLFGAGKEFSKPSYNEVLDSPVFDAIPFVKALQSKEKSSWARRDRATISLSLAWWKSRTLMRRWGWKQACILACCRIRVRADWGPTLQIILPKSPKTNAACRKKRRTSRGST